MFLRRRTRCSGTQYSNTMIPSAMPRDQRDRGRFINSPCSRSRSRLRSRSRRCVMLVFIHQFKRLILSLSQIHLHRFGVVASDLVERVLAIVEIARVETRGLDLDCTSIITHPAKLVARVASSTHSAPTRWSPGRVGARSRGNRGVLV